ncbi:TonB-dependent receptor [Chitinophaga agrisoli]|uniref:TonB-dependent receptor n=1 Tax=Chitinophaga agrisoli TaxID=2607653 RepID=A0A5B2W211_9BACT|nr:TonB-dependent receptor [Chitinophaga agrisoli]KAA2245395.1 TonB-dependent receptor [Chitinophaga agrisoli]
MRRKFYFFFPAIILGATTLANAQDTSRTNQLNELVVTASRFPQKSGETGKVVTVLAADYLQKHSGQSLTSILNNQAGLIVNGSENAAGTNQDVYMRGATTGNTLILIDGIPASDASQITNAFDLNFIPVSQIERVEILRGSQSTLYGSDAVAGVINIITKKPGDKKIGLSANGSYGSYKSWQGGAGINGSVGKFSYIAGYQYNKSDGFSSAFDSAYTHTYDNDGFKRHSVFAKAALQVTNRWKLQYLLNWSDYHTDLDAGGYTDDKDYTMHNKYMLHAISSRLDFKKGSWNVVYSFQQNKRNLLDDTLFTPNAGFSTSQFSSNTHQVETFVNWDIIPQLQLIAGADARFSNTDQYNMLYSEFYKDTTVLSGDSAHMRQFSHYAALLLHNVGGFNLEVGGRFNYHNIYGSNQTISFNPSYLINDQHKIFVNISSAFKVPTLYQLYSEYGNKDLQPESSVNYEAGYQGALCDNRLNLRVVGFYRETKNLISFYSLPDPPYGKYINANKQQAYGGELEANWEIVKGLQLNVNYTYTDGKVKELDTDTSYFNLYRIPKHALNLELGYNVTPALYVSAQYKYNSQRWEPQYLASPKPLGDYYTLGAYAEYRVGRFLKVYADFRNITDQQYFMIAGYNTRRFNFTSGVTINL